MIYEAGVGVKARHPITGNNFEDIIVNRIVPKIGNNNHKRTLTQGNYQFNYSYSGTYIYFCVADDDQQKRTCWGYIDDIEKSFLKQPSASQTIIQKMLADKMVRINIMRRNTIVYLMFFRNFITIPAMTRYWTYQGNWMIQETLL